MSRGLDRDDEQREEKLDTRSRMSLFQGRAEGGGDTEDDRADRAPRDARARREKLPLTDLRDRVRYGRHRDKRSFTGHAVIREVGGRRTRDGSVLMRHCFLDRFPLFTRPGAKELAFCYVDSVFETSGPFVTHLRRYLPLFAELTSFELVYVTTASTRLGQAQTVFERVLSRGRKWLAKVVDPDRLLAHFRDRQLFEKRETSDFDRLRLDALRDDMCCFSGRHFAQMFARLKASGDEGLRAEIAAQETPSGRFSFCPTITTCLDSSRRRREPLDEPRFGERSKKGPFTSVSMEAFTKDSLQNPSKRAVRPSTWRIDPCFGVKGGAGATPVSVGCAATNPPDVAALRRGSFPPLPFQEPVHFVIANRIAG